MDFGIIGIGFPPSDPIRLRSGQAFRRGWETLNKWHSPRQADIAYLRILDMAAKTSETEVSAALEAALQSKTRWSDKEIAAALALPKRKAPPQMQQQTVSPAIYDALLQEVADE